MRIHLQVFVLVVFLILPIFSISDEEDNIDLDDLINQFSSNEQKISDYEKTIKEQEENYDPDAFKNALLNATTDLENELSQCRNESKDQTAQLEDLRSKKLQNDDALQIKDKEIASLNAELKKLQANNESIAKKMEENSLTITTLKSTIEDKNKQIAKFETQINKTERELSLRNDEIAQLRTKHKNTELELKNLQAFNSNLSQSLEECRSQEQSLQSSKKSYEASIREKDADITKLTEMNSIQSKIYLTKYSKCSKLTLTIIFFLFLNRNY